MYQIAVDSKVYIGITAKTQSTVDKRVRSRIAKHCYRAQTEGLNWLLCKALRKLDCKEDIEYTVLAVVRGKPAAHEYERDLIRKLNPALNSDKRGA